MSHRTFRAAAWLAGPVAAVLIVAAATAPTATAAATCPGSKRVPSPAQDARARAALMCLVNRVRLDHGRRALRSSRPLRQAAQAHTDQMASGGFFSHVSPTGSTPLERSRSAGYRGRRVAENLAWGTMRLASPEAAVAAWMRSPGHRANLLAGSYREAGVGIAHATPTGRAGATYALTLGAPG